MKICFVVYDNDSHIAYFPLGTAYLAAALRQAGHSVTIYAQDVYHYPEEHLTAYLSRNKFDLVGIGIIGGYYQYKKLLALSRAINNVLQRPWFVIGGHGPAPEPEFFIKRTGADVVVIGEADRTILNLVAAIENGNGLKQVRGIAYRDGDACIVNEREPLISKVDDILFPAWDLFNIDFYALLRQPGVKPSDRFFQIITGRGCPFSCNFCYRMDPGFRQRSPESVIEEMNRLKTDYSISFVEFTDDLFMFGEDQTIAFCEKIQQANLGIHFNCEGRLNYASRRVLRAMKNAGCVFVNYGIESLDDQILKNMNKGLTVAQIEQGIENTVAEGLYPGLNIIFGNIGENYEVLQKGVNFLKKYNTYSNQFRTIRPVTPYPGSPLYYQAIKEGLLKGPEDFYDNKHLNSDLMAVNFTELSDEAFYEALFAANKQLIQEYFHNAQQDCIETMRKLYFEKDLTFRGFRQT